MPRGIPVATVAIDNATNAALLAVRMLGIGDSSLVISMNSYMEKQQKKVEESIVNLAETVKEDALILG